MKVFLLSLLCILLVVFSTIEGVHCLEEKTSGEEDEFFDSPDIEEEPVSVVEPVKQPEEHRQKRTVFGFQKQESYLLEGIAALVLLVYILNWRSGKKENDRIVAAWAKEYRAFLREQFAQVGAGKGILLREYYNTFSLFATGRRNCDFLVGTFDMVKRHDLVSRVLHYIGSAPDPDTLTLRIAMKTNVEPFAFALVRSKDAKKLSTEPELLTANAIENSDLPADMKCFSEFELVSNSLLSKEVIETLRKYGDFLMHLYVTDRNEKYPSDANNIIEVKLKLPKTMDEIVRMKTLLKMVLFFVDRVADLRLSTGAKTQALKRRSEMGQKGNEEAVADEKKRLNDAATERKIKRKEAEDERISRLPAAEQRKAEERRRKREMRRKILGLRDKEERTQKERTFIAAIETKIARQNSNEILE